MPWRLTLRCAAAADCSIVGLWDCLLHRGLGLCSRHGLDMNTDELDWLSYFLHGCLFCLLPHLAKLWLSFLPLGSSPCASTRVGGGATARASFD